MRLSYYRKKIDVIDRNIIKLLLIRFKLVKKIAEHKKTNKLGIIDEERELHIINNIKKYSDEKYQKFITNIFKNIINYSKKLQK